MNCKEAISLVHDYLDKEAIGRRLLDLKDHLNHCSKCRHHFKQLEKADAVISILTRPRVPDGLTERIAQSVLPPKKKVSWLRWAKRYPALSVATVFFFIMLGSIMALWNQQTELMVKGDDLEHVVIEGDRVIVPEGRTINGNLIVENARIQVDGHINGNLVVIDGSILSAATANISGEITSVNQSFQWIWYKINQFVSMISNK